MHKTNPKLRLAIAQKAIFRYFEHGGKLPPDCAMVRHYLKRMNRENAARLSMRILKMRCENALISSLISAQTPEKQRFIIEKFRQGLPDMQISMMFYSHPQSIQKWKTRILEDTASLILLELPKSMLFSLNVIRTLYYAIGAILRYCKRQGAELADPVPLRILEERRKKYRSLYRCLKGISEAEIVEGIESQVIKAKLCHRFATIKELAQLSGYSEGTVSEKMQAFIRRYGF